MSTRPVGWLLVMVGFFPILIALGVIPAGDEAHAPMWVIGLCGVVFVSGGIMALIGRESRFTAIFAALLCGCFMLVGVWVAAFAPAEGFSGGLPLLSQATNVTLARWVFGLGALMCGGVSLYAIREFFKQDQ